MEKTVIKVNELYGHMGKKLKRICQFTHKRHVSCDLELLVAGASNPIKIQCN